MRMERIRPLRQFQRRSAFPMTAMARPNLRVSADEVRRWIALTTGLSDCGQRSITQQLRPAPKELTATGRSSGIEPVAPITLNHRPATGYAGADKEWRGSTHTMPRSFA